MDTEHAGKNGGVLLGPSYGLEQTEDSLRVSFLIHQDNLWLWFAQVQAEDPATPEVLHAGEEQDVIRDPLCTQKTDRTWL